MSKIKFVLFIAAVASVTLMTGAAQGTKHLCEGFVPENDMKIPVGDKSHPGIRGGGGITEAQYHKIMDRIQEMYGNWLAQQGKTLVINRLWSDATVNASAQQQGNQWIINMYGGIARHPDMNYEGQALIACHEMGHHIGGAPKIAGMFGNQWATNEGGSDYFGTLKCLRVFFEKEDNASIVGAAQIDPVARAKCQAAFTTNPERDVCMRISMGAEAVSYLFQDLSKDTTRPKFDTPDTTQASKMDDNHPKTQCRMDTYFAGALCPKPVSEWVSDSDYKTGTCVQGVESEGWRPLCWFNPNGGGGGGGGGGGDCPLGDQSVCDELCKIMPDLPFCN